MLRLWKMVCLYYHSWILCYLLKPYQNVCCKLLVDTKQWIHECREQLSSVCWLLIYRIFRTWMKHCWSSCAPVNLSFLDEFQLFKKPHPPKRVRSRLNGEAAGTSVPPGSTSDKIFFHHLDNLRPSLAPVKGKTTVFGVFFPYFI